jgi:hypothetical protein
MPPIHAEEQPFTPPVHTPHRLHSAALFSRSYEEDWRKPAIGFTMNLSITAVVSLLVVSGACCRARQLTFAASVGAPPI